jgi:hypothetical protein
VLFFFFFFFFDSYPSAVNRTGERFYWERGPRRPALWTTVFARCGLEAKGTDSQVKAKTKM